MIFGLNTQAVGAQFVPVGHWLFGGFPPALSLRFSGTFTASWAHLEFGRVRALAFFAAACFGCFLGEHGGGGGGDGGGGGGRWRRNLEIFF